MALFLYGMMGRECQGQSTQRGDDLIGLWGSETPLGPQVRGELLLERRGRRWTARVGGFEGVTEQVGDSVVLSLPGGQGVLRAWIRTTIKGESLDAYWIQPPVADGEAPYATPVRLTRTGSRSWRGELRPLDVWLPIYLRIERGGDGSLRGIFRNPSANWPGRGGAYRVEPEGETVVFIDPRTAKPRYRQPYDSARRTIAFDFGVPVVLTPRTLEQAPGFVTRAPSLPSYEYREPAALGDQWPVARAGSVGIDEARMQGIVRALVAADPVDDSAPRVHSLVVARRGRLVLDEYFHGYSPEALHDLRSASKTMTSVMAGTAMRSGARFTMASRVDSGATTAAITVGDLLAHRSGLACDDDDDASPGNEDTMQSQRAEPDWYRFTLSLPRVHPPGTTYAYCSAGINLVGRTIGTATRTWLPAYFDRALARPLGIERYAINLMPNGEGYAAGGMQLRPRDLLKFGELYRGGGRWKGGQLVSAEWVAMSTARQIDRSDGSQDGFGWHRHVLRAHGREYQTYEASGNGGQFLVVVPELELVVVVTAGNYGQYGVWRKIREELVPAVMGAAR